MQGKRGIGQDPGNTKDSEGWANRTQNDLLGIRPGNDETADEDIVASRDIQPGGMKKTCPTDPAESAIVQTLDPGPYTAIVSGVGGTTGVALVEAYDIDAAAASELANISTRGLVGTGDDVMIGGFIIVGGAARAIPSWCEVLGLLSRPTEWSGR